MIRKKCETCGEYLGSIGKRYLHPEKPCSGITDAVKIEIDVVDEDLQELFEDKYGTPKMSDYEMLNVYEKDMEKLHNIIKEQCEQLNVYKNDITEHHKIIKEHVDHLDKIYGNKLLKWLIGILIKVTK